MSLRFLARFDCQDRADWLTPKRLGAFLAGIRYCGSTTPEAMHARIAAAPCGATNDAGAAAVHVTRALVAALQALIVQVDALTDQITEQLHARADAHIFRSLPRTQALRAARLLAEIGDVRGRFPTPEALASLAGVSPSTRKSGKNRVVGFRWAVDRQLRDALVEWAGDSRLSSPWAADIYRRARARGHGHPDAVQVLARAWVYVIWRCWQDGVAYDPARHGGAQRLSPQRPRQLRDRSRGGLDQAAGASRTGDPLPDPCHSRRGDEPVSAAAAVVVEVWRAEPRRRWSRGAGRCWLVYRVMMIVSSPTSAMACRLARAQMTLSQRC